nr:protein detoxification 45, chloroplastic [Quercus suber]
MTAKDAYKYFVLKAQEIAISKNWTPVNWEETFNTFAENLNPRHWKSIGTISTVLSQYIVTFLLIWHLNKRAVLLPPKLGSLQFGGYLKSGGFFLGRTLCPVAMAAHQICIQVWLAVSLLMDALAAAGQALIASSFSKGDYQSVKDITDYVLKAYGNDGWYFFESDSLKGHPNVKAIH